MDTITIGLASRATTKARFVAAMNGKKQGSFISFATPELLFKVLTPMRWQIIQTMTGAGPMSIRELSRRLERDVKRVHEDVHALLNNGVLDRTESGEIVFPYDRVHVDFEIESVSVAA